VSVRGAGVADLAAIAALERAVFGADAYPAFFFRQALDLWPAHLCVSSDPARGDGIEGYALGAPSTRSGDGWLLSLAVDPARRGQGDAQALVGAVLESFAIAGFDRVTLTVTPENGAAVRLYERVGFRVEAEEAHYFGPGERRWRMVRWLR
jgi:ribosomal-protein-alanine N-acetyltransferase